MTRAEEGSAQPERTATPLAVLFPGQGAQRAGMAARLVEFSRAARLVFEEADRALDLSLSRLCVEADDEELADTTNTQPALLATSIAYFEHLKERLRELGSRLSPHVVTGHSLGQFSAAVASESISLPDGLRLVSERGRLMKEWARERPGGLAAIMGLDRAVVADLCLTAAANENVSIAAHNSPGQYVVSGDLGALERAIRLANERGGVVRRLPISVPGHTPVMESVAADLREFMKTIEFHDPNAPIVSNINGGLLTTADEVMQELADQICAAVEWVRCMGSMVNQGVATFVEIGPGRTLSGIARRFSDNLRFVTVEDANSDDLARLQNPNEAQQPA